MAKGLGKHSGSVFTYCLRMMWKCQQRGAVKILIFSLLILSLYTFTTWMSSKKIVPMEGLSMLHLLFRDNSSWHIDNVPELSHLSYEERFQVMKNSIRSVDHLLKYCSLPSLLDPVCSKQIYEKDLLTLFTTWEYDEDKFIINNKTLYNWKRLPRVNVVVFTNSEKVRHFSSLAGWHVLPIKEQAADAPLLAAMFQEVMKSFSSTFYGYANGDLLFTDDLPLSLEKIMCELIIKRNMNKIVVVGRRVNIASSRITYKDALSWKSIQDQATKYGSVFQPNAEDYFITDKHYPWKDFLPMAVGRRGYDNWVVTYSRLNNVTVIDASEGILCLHQTLASRGNFEGLHKGVHNRYNIELVEKLKLSFSYSGWGKTDCATYIVWKDICRKVIISKRQSLHSDCTSYYWWNGFLKMLGLNSDHI